MQKSYKIYSNSSHFHLNTQNILFCFYHCEGGEPDSIVCSPAHCTAAGTLTWNSNQATEELEVAFPLDHATCTLLWLVAADADNQTIRRYVARMDGEILIAINNFFWHRQHEHTDDFLFHYSDLQSRPEQIRWWHSWWPPPRRGCLCSSAPWTSAGSSSWAPESPRSSGYCGHRY